jgi:hypothetical protein
MRRLRAFLIACFAVGGLLALAGFNASRPRLMVLHSGSERALWVQDVDRGMQQELDRNRRPVSLTRHYLRLDEPDLGPEAIRVRVQDAHRAIARMRPDVLIAVDDEANALVARDYVGRGRPKVLYVSIDQPPAEYGYQSATTVTGISEELPLAAVRDALGDLRNAPDAAGPDRREDTAGAERLPGRPPSTALGSGQPLRIAAIARDSESGRAELAQVRQFDWSPHQLGPTAAVRTLPEWQERCRSLAGSADILLVLSYRGFVREGGGGGLVPGAELAEWLEQESVPLPVGLDVGYVVDGGGWSLAPAPLDYGEGGMRMALEWLEPARNGELPESWRSSHFDVALRASRLRRRGLWLPPIYAEAARAGNDYYD